MLYRPYIQKLYAAINLPIHRYVYKTKPTHQAENPTKDFTALAPTLPTEPTSYTTTRSASTAPARNSHDINSHDLTSHDLTALKDNSFSAPANTLVLSETYEPRGISAQYRQQALDFAQKLHLNIGDKIYMRGTQDLAAVLLPDYSLVVVGPIHVNKNTTTNPNPPLTKGITADSTNALNSAPLNSEKNSRQSLTTMQRNIVNLWLDMVCQIVMRDVIPPIPEIQAYAEADRLIPSNLKNITKEVQLKAPHNQYRYELAILDAVAEGDLDKVNRAFLVPKQGKFGVLGPTELRSMQNHVHNLNSLVSRTAIHSGILPEKAYALSDKFFMAAEACTTVEQCIELRTICARSFAALIKEYRQQHLQPLPNLVRNAQLIVSRSLYENCTVASLAQKLQVSPDHLERIFKKNMGLKLSTYIYQEKIKEAQELLLNTNESISDIAQVLGFKAASHFARCFKHFTGMSPREYRNCQSRLNQG